MTKALGTIVLAMMSLTICYAQPAAKGHLVSQHANCDSAGDSCDVIFVSHPSDKKTIWEIFMPNVIEPQTSYPMIKFKPGDSIKVTAGGCVQSGGMGSTWHLYVNPQGGSSPTYYSGTIFIPGAIPLDSGDVTGYPRIGGYVYQLQGGDARTGYKYGPTLQIPAELPDTLKKAGFTSNDFFLHLGFEDEAGDYGDNGYYSHDNGPNNQCLDVGNAWVEIEVTSDTATNHDLSPHYKPFDVVWDEDDGYDGNLLPLNPVWTAQLGQVPGGPAVDPDFTQVCKPAFVTTDLIVGSEIVPVYTGNIDQNALRASCTTQEPTLDPHGYSFFNAFGLCSPDPLSGHLNWYNVTYQGTIYWESASGSWPNDNDINLQLAPVNNGGVTTLNSGTLGLEFDSTETINNYKEPYWQPGTIGTSMNGNPAVVTGIMGIDGVHGGWTEIHPVLALAIWTDEKESGDGVDDTWVFFLRNSGDEGGCGSGNQHSWQGLSPNFSGPGWYFLNLPWREHATDFHMTNFEGWASQTGIKGPATIKGAGWVYIGFQLPDPGNAIASVDGQFTVHYKLGKDHLDRPRPPDHLKGHPEEEANWSDIINKVKDPSTRAKITDFFSANKPALITPLPHKFTLDHAEPRDALIAMASIKVEDRERLRKDHVKPDPARQQAMDDFDKKLKAFWPTDLKLPPLPADYLSPRK